MSNEYKSHLEEILMNKIRKLERENRKLRYENKKLRDMISRLKQKLNSKICPRCGVPCV